MNLTKPATVLVLSLVVGLVGGLLLGFIAAAPSHATAEAATRVSPAALESIDASAHTEYACPMHPEVVRHAPGRCPVCGMDLVPVTQAASHVSAAPADDDAITIAPEVVNNLGVHTARVHRADIGREATMSAYVQGYTAGAAREVRTPVGGRIVGLPAGGVGHWVKRGDVLLEVTSPERDAAQAQHLKVLETHDAAALEASRLRLRELAFSGEDIARLEKERKPLAVFVLRAPLDGQVAALACKAGDDIVLGAPVFTLQTMGQATVDVDVFQSQVSWLRSGDAAELRVRHLPGKVWKGTVAMEGVRVNPEKRTYGVRLLFPVPEGQVGSDMLAEVRVSGGVKHGVLTVPREALIRTGQGNRVVLALGNGRYRPVEVTPGLENGERVEIVAGLHEGDEVVISAQFLIDSESSLRAEFRRMAGAEQGGKMERF